MRRGGGRWPQACGGQWVLLSYCRMKHRLTVLGQEECVSGLAGRSGFPVCEAKGRRSFQGLKGHSCSWCVHLCILCLNSCMCFSAVC